MTMTRKLILASAAALLAAGLGACSRSQPDAPAPESDNQSMEAPDTPAPLPSAAPEEPAPMPEATAAATDVNTSAEALPPPEAAAAPDEQMMDDASATGMTARASRDEHPTDAPATGQQEDK